MRREGREDPFNTPFENWYAEQKSDPFSGVSLFGRYLRIMLWGVLFIGTLRVLGFIRGRGQIRREQQEEYLRMAEQDRMHRYAVEQQRMYAEHIAARQNYND